MRDALIWAALVTVAGIEIWGARGDLARQGGWGDRLSWAEVTIAALLAGAVIRTGRRWPLWSLPLAAGANLAEVLGPSGSRFWPILISTVGCFLAGRRMTDGLAALPGFAAVALIGLVIAVLGGNVWDWAGCAISLLLFGVLPWLAGRYARLRAGLAAAGWQRAEQLELQRRLIVTEARLRERTRIAQDMHDSLGHELSLIAMRAGALELDRRLDPRHQAAIGELRATAVDATERLHEIVDVLRDDTDATPTSPDSIGDLVARSRASGMDIELTLDPPPRPMPPMVARAAYRIVQEGLTNAAKHAPGAAVTVRLAHSASGLRVTVGNGPPAGTSHPAASGGGRGLAGLHERVRLVGGALHARQQPGGYEIVADLPLAGGPDPAAGSSAVPPATVGVVGDASADGSESARAFAQTRSATRRGVFTAAGVTLALCAAVLLILLGLRIYEVRSSWLDPAVYDSLRIGQREADITGSLPPQQVVGRPDVPQPPVPAGARCHYYRVPADLFAGPIDVYRLCFADGTLIDKDLIPGSAP